MHLELLTVGTELLLGFTVDTNSAEIGRRAAAVGVRVVRRTSVGDAGSEIAEGVAAALARSGAVLTTGGLGPTSDDVTKTAVCERLGLALRFDEATWARLVERFARLGRTPSPANRSQAMVPDGATVLPNRWGTAPGLWLEGAWGLVIMLPGVPLEMRMLLEHEVVPRLAARTGERVVRSRVVRTAGIPESTLADRLGDVETVVAPATLAYLPGIEGVDLRLTAWQLPAAEADAVLARGERVLLERAREYAYGVGDSSLAEVVVNALRAARRRVAVGESCTGGLLAGRITDVAGSSEVFDGGVVAYANEVKQRDLGVAGALLEAHGAVSEPVAAAMADGVRARFGVEFGLAVTGIAGPGGGSPAKPVGTVWFAVAGPDGTTTHHAVLPGTRPEVRARAAQTALLLLWRRLGAAHGADIGLPV
ncbi:MAG: competence/damage-inducible protein A [Gemmatimonadales bacterium]|nr:competence/damage-inducible protein A [Gemmatimonadales bacterium]